MVGRPWCLWGFVVALTFPLLSHYHHQFSALWFPPSGHKLGGRTLVSDSQPHRHRLMVLGKYFLLPVIHVCYQQKDHGQGVAGGTRTLFPLTSLSRCPFGSFPNL